MGPVPTIAVARFADFDTVYYDRGAIGHSPIIATVIWPDVSWFPLGLWAIVGAVRSAIAEGDWVILGGHSVDFIITSHLSRHIWVSTMQTGMPTTLKGSGDSASGMVWFVGFSFWIVGGFVLGFGLGVVLLVAEAGVEGAG
jgi:hypothetical protein